MHYQQTPLPPDFGFKEQDTSWRAGQLGLQNMENAKYRYPNMQ